MAHVPLYPIGTARDHFLDDRTFEILASTTVVEVGIDVRGSVWRRLSELSERAPRLALTHAIRWICLETVGGGGLRDPQVDIAVDPIDGTTLTSKGLPNAIAVIAVITAQIRRSGHARSDLDPVVSGSSEAFDVTDAAESLLAVKAVSWDHNRRFYESYEYINLDLNPGLTDADFDPDNEEYGF